MESEYQARGPHPERSKRRRLALIGCTVILTVASLPVVAGAALVARSVYQDYANRIAFDAQDWRASADEQGMWPTRLRMASDLIASRKLIGLETNEVIELLGPPAPPGHPGGARRVALHYLFGPERGLFRIDDEWLLIDVDDAGKVDRAWLYTD